MRWEKAKAARRAAGVFLFGKNVTLFPEDGAARRPYQSQLHHGR